MATRQSGSSKKNKTNGAEVEACPETRYAIGTSEFVGRCKPRCSVKMEGSAEKSRAINRRKKGGLKGKTNSFDDMGKGYRYQEPLTWGDWQKAVDEGNMEKANRIYRVLKAEENRPKPQPAKPLTMKLGEMLALKGIEVNC